MRCWRQAAILLIMISLPGRTQTRFLRNAFVRPYQARPVRPVDFQNSQRIFNLIRAGQLYLSLADAIALALENNLDIELERYLPRIAETDVQRSEGGGFLRGLALLVNEPPPGIGGPNGPLLTNLTAGSTPSPAVNTNFSDIALITQQQNDLSLTGLIPLSPGPPIPQFDPLLSVQVSGSHLSTAEFSPALTGGNWLVTNNVSGDLIWSQGFSPGTQLNMTFDNTRLTSNSIRYSFNPLLSSSLGFTITQPLLRGFGSELNRRYEHIARNSEEIADLVFRQQVIDTVSGIARLYTDLLSLNEDVKVKREALVLAERLYEDNKNKVDQGTLPPIEVTRAQAQVAANQGALISATGLVQQQELIVKTFITRRGLDIPAIRDAHIIVTDTLTVPEAEPARPLQELMAEGVRNRPDLAQAGLQVVNSRISLKGSLNAVRPELDVIGMVQNGGLSGGANRIAALTQGTPAFTGGYASTLKQVFANNFPSYSIGLQLTLPIRNRIAQADAVRDELQLRQTEVQRQQLEDQVRLEVADAFVSMQQAWASYKAAVQARVLQEQSVSVEEQAFSVGIATNYMVIQYQTLLAQARSTEVAAKGAYVKARIALERATGTTLNVNHISLWEAQEGRVTRPAARIPDAR
jgi:outer membrane protein